MAVFRTACVQGAASDKSRKGRLHATVQLDHHPLCGSVHLSKAAEHPLPDFTAGHDRMGTSVWLGLSLWAVMGVGEAGLMQQSSLAIALWCCLFGLPSLYLQCRHILDALVEESLHLVALSLRTGGHASCTQSVNGHCSSHLSGWCFAIE